MKKVLTFALILVGVAGVLLVVVALGIYLATHTDRFYNHFVWQASAFRGLL